MHVYLSFLRALALIRICILSFISFLQMLLLFFSKRVIKLGKFHIRNYLGGYKWLNDYAYELYIIAIGIMLMVVTISVMFFAMGFMVTIVQVTARILCKNVMSVTIFGQSPLDVCIILPFMEGSYICGWDVMVVCANITNMDVSLGYYMVKKLEAGATFLPHTIQSNGRPERKPEKLMLSFSICMLISLSFFCSITIRQ